MLIRITLAAAVVTALAAAPVHAASLTVGQGLGRCPHAQFASIQAAVDNARPGDTVKVCPGTYEEQVTITKPLTLRGPGDEGDCSTGAAEAIVDPVEVGFSVAIRLAADDVTVRGLVIQGASVGIDAADRYSGYRVTHNRIEGNGLFAIDAGSAGAEVSRFDHNCLRGNGYGLVSELDDDSSWPLTPDGSGRGAHARYLRNARVDHNQSTGNGSGVEAAGPGAPVDVSFDHNHSQGDGVGVAIQNSTSSEVIGNEIVDATGNGIAVGGNNRDLVIAANVAHSRTAALNFVPGGFFDVFPSLSRSVLIRANDLRSQTATGLAAGFDALVDSLIEANVVDANGLGGLSLARGNSVNLVRGNEVSGNGRNGIAVFAGATGNTLVGNVMHANGALNPLTFFDARDENTPLNTWIDNECGRDFPAGAICGA